MKNSIVLVTALLIILVGTSACPLQSKIAKKSNTDDTPMEAEMIWSSGRESRVTRNIRKVKTYGEGSYGVEEPITLPSTLPEEIDLELPAVQGGGEATHARARLEISVGSENPEEKLIEAYYLRESPETGKKTKLRVRIKKMNEAVKGKPYFKGTLRLTINRYDGRRIEFAFNIRSKPKGLTYDWGVVQNGLNQKSEETSEGKPVYAIARLRVTNESNSSVFAEFTALPDYLAGYRIETVNFDDQSCPRSSGTYSVYTNTAVVEKLVIVPEGEDAASFALQVLEQGSEPLNRSVFSAGETKTYLVFAVDRKKDPEVQMSTNTFLGGCQEICVRQTCEQTPGRGGGRDNCYCNEKGWKRTPLKLQVGTRISDQAIFSVTSSSAYTIRYAFPGDEGPDQFNEQKIIGDFVQF